MMTPKQLAALGLLETKIKSTTDRLIEYCKDIADEFSEQAAGVKAGYTPRGVSINKILEVERMSAELRQMKEARDMLKYSIEEV